MNIPGIVTVSRPITRSSY